MLRISPSPDHALLRFDCGVGKPRKAILRPFNTAQTSGAQAAIGVFRCRQGHDVPDQELILGLAAKYPRDQGLAHDSDVVCFTDFEADSWRDEWSQVANRNASETVDGGKLPGFSGTYGKAGWGGRKVDGTDGWSARGSFGLAIPAGNPLALKVPVDRGSVPDMLTR